MRSLLARRLSLLVALLAVVAVGAPAQRPDRVPAAGDRPLAFDRVGQARGLSHGTVTAVVQDPAGFLWLGTEDGLNRHDGAGFTVFRPAPADTTSLADGWISGLAVGPDGSLWVATLHGGLHRHRPASDGFVRYRAREADATTLGSDRVNAVHVARDGIVWVGTVRGLDRLDPATGAVRHHAPRPGEPAALANDVLAVAEDADGRLWVGGRTGLFRFDPARGTFTPVGDGRPWFPVRAIRGDRHGRLWVGSENALVAVDPARGRVVRRFDQPAAGRASPIAGRVLSLADGADGTLLVGSDGGLTVLDPATGAYRLHTPDRRDPHALAGAIVRSALVDRGGVLWVGLETHGLAKHAPSTVRFALLPRDPADPGALTDGYVRGMAEDRAGNVWIGTQLGGLNRRDPRTGRITAYRHRPGDPRTLPGDNVWAVHEDRGGTLWVGLHHGGLGTLDPRTGAFTRSPHVPAGLSVNVVVEDRAGALLVGLEGNGLVEISPDRRHARSWGATRGATPHPARVLANDDVQAILEARDGALWVGGVDGLTRLDRRRGTATRFRGVPGRDGSLGTDFVTHLHEDRAGRIWVATKGAGIARWEPATRRFETLGAADGIPHPFVYGILEDARGRLWLSTDDGLAALDPRTGAVARYGLADGLQAREFNRRALLRTAGGTMYFGGVDGVNVFRPDAAAPPPGPPVVAVVSLRAAGEAARPLRGWPAGTPVRIAHDRSTVTLAYAALDYTAPEKARYAYRMDGVDRDWVPAGDRREVSYAGLRPGRYVFRVIAANAHGEWNREGAALVVDVAAPWWATTWARALGVLLVAAAAGGASHLRLAAVRRQSAVLERRVAEQTRDLTGAEARLREALARERTAARELADITAAVPGVVFRLHEDAAGRRALAYVSEGIVRLVGDDGAADPAADPRAVAGALLAGIDADDRAALWRALAASRASLDPWHAEFGWAPRAGDARWLVVHARPSRAADGSTVWTGVLTDGTPARRAQVERAALEARMLHAQKAESLAVLAGGIAHDFNNLLVGVLANAELVEDDVAPGSDAAESAALIRDSARRAAELTQQMLAYAGRGRLVVERVDLARLVPDMLALVRSGVPRTVAFDVRAERAQVPVEGDATQLRQVVMNLATNAAEAIGDRPGRVTVRVAIEAAPQAELALHHAAPGMPARGPYAVLEVADDGCGMDAALLDRIFDPFFTTKFTGRGLGLAALLGIVRAHRGGLRVTTAPGAGARFALYLPLAAAAPAPVPAPRPAPGAAPVPSLARVLVVDDEPAVRRTAERILRAAGYAVDGAADGEEAVAACAGAGRGGGAAPAVVVMDVTMPRLDGPAAAAALRARGVDVPIVLMSGYAEEELAARIAPGAVDGFLKKPFTADELREVVAAVTRREPAAAEGAWARGH